MGEGENVANQHFSFSHNVFHPSQSKYKVLSHVEIFSFCNLQYDFNLDKT